MKKLQSWKGIIKKALLKGNYRKAKIERPQLKSYI